MKKILLAGGLLAVLAIGLMCGLRDRVERAPDFELIALDGQSLRLTQFRNKVLFLNFWATWCPPCRAEIPDFIAAYKAHRSEGLAIIGVSLDRLSEGELKSFVTENRMTYPIAFATEKIFNDYQPGDYIPTTIVIDKHGQIRKRIVGATDRQTLEDLFSTLIAE